MFMFPILFFSNLVIVGFTKFIQSLLASAQYPAALACGSAHCMRHCCMPMCVAHATCETALKRVDLLTNLHAQIYFSNPRDARRPLDLLLLTVFGNVRWGEGDLRLDNGDLRLDRGDLRLDRGDLRLDSGDPSFAFGVGVLVLACSVTATTAETKEEGVTRTMIALKRDSNSFADNLANVASQTSRARFVSSTASASAEKASCE